MICQCHLSLLWDTLGVLNSWPSGQIWILVPNLDHAFVASHRFMGSFMGHSLCAGLGFCGSAGPDPSAWGWARVAWGLLWPKDEPCEIHWVLRARTLRTTVLYHLVCGHWVCKVRAGQRSFTNAIFTDFCMNRKR